MQPPACGPPSAQATGGGPPSAAATARRPASCSHTAGRPQAPGLPSALRPRAFWRRAEAFAQAGRKAKSTRSMPPGFDFSAAPRLPPSSPMLQHRLPWCAVAAPQATAGWEDDAAMLATASSRLGERGNREKIGKGANRKSDKMSMRAQAQTPSVRGERPITEFLPKRGSELRSNVPATLANCRHSSSRSDRESPE